MRHHAKQPAVGDWACLPLVVVNSKKPQTFNGLASSLSIPPATMARLERLSAPTIQIIGLFGPKATGKRLFLRTLLNARESEFERLLDPDGIQEEGEVERNGDERDGIAQSQERPHDQADPSASNGATTSKTAHQSEKVLLWIWLPKHADSELFFNGSRDESSFSSLLSTSSSSASSPRRSSAPAISRSSSASPKQSLALGPSGRASQFMRRSSSVASDAGDSQTSVKVVISCGENVESTPNGEEDASPEAKTALALMCLLSSAVFYNESGEIDAQALDKLEWLHWITQSIRIKPNQEDTDVANGFAKHAPRFIWLARNFKIKWLMNSVVANKSGGGNKKLTALQYFEKNFAHEDGLNDTVLKRNMRRSFFQSLFGSRDCIALSRALENEQDVAWSHLRQELRSQFVESVEQIYERFLSAQDNEEVLPFKKLANNQFVQAQHFGLLVETYINALNNQTLPTMQLAANVVMQRALEEGFAKACRIYDEQFAAFCRAGNASYGATANHNVDLHDQHHVVTFRRVQLAHYHSFELAEIHLRELKKMLPESVKKKEFDEKREQWKRLIEKSLQERMAQNKKEYLAKSHQLYKSLLPSNLDQMTQELSESPDLFGDGLSEQLTKYKSDLKRSLQEYKSKMTIIPSFDPTLRDAYVSIFKAINSWSAIVLNHFQEHLGKLETQVLELQESVEIAKASDTSTSFSTEDQKRLYEEQLEQLTEQLTELRKVLRKELDAKRVELERLTNEIRTMDVRQENKVTNMEKEIEYERNKIAELNASAREQQLQREQHTAGVTQTLLMNEKSFHEENQQLLAQQKELMTRIMEIEKELVQKKTRHMQKMFVLENELHSEKDTLTNEHNEAIQQLKTQAKSDIGMLRLVYQQKKNNSLLEMERVHQDIQDIEAKLVVLEQAARKAARNKTFFGALSSIGEHSESSLAAGTASISRTKSAPDSSPIRSNKQSPTRLKPAFSLADVLLPPDDDDKENTNVNRNDGDMCTQS